MRRLNTAQFKREYRSLTEPVLVTSGGKSVGVWTPTIARLPDFAAEERHGAVVSRNQVPARTWHATTANFTDGMLAIAKFHDGVNDIVDRVLSWKSFDYPKEPGES